MRKINLSCVALVTLGCVASAGCGSAEKPVADRLTPVKLADVRVKGHVAELQGTFFANRIFGDFARKEIWKEAHEAFAHPDDDVFNHGIGMWKGEFWGKLMISACRVAEHTGDRELQEFLHQEALELIKFQHEDGYLGTYVDKEYVVPLPLAEQQKRVGWPCPWNWNLWCRKYTLWGLLSAYRLTGDRKLLEAADRAMAQQIDMLERCGLKLCDTGTSTMRGFPPCSILKPLVWLYQETGKRRYLDYAKEIVGYFDDPSGRAVPFAAKLATGAPMQDWYPAENGQWGKAYEMMSCLDGFVEYYRATGDVRALDVAKGMRERIYADELNLCLSVGYNDQFWGAKRHLNGVSEPCDAVHWMRLNHDLWLVTGDAKYVDAIEETFYNAFLAAIRPDGKWGARCVRSHGRHQPAPPQSGMTLQHCCVNNMPRGFMDVAQTTVARDRDGAICLALYHDFEARLGADTVRVSGGFPVESAVTATFDLAAARTVRLRVPAWCAGMSVRGAGKDACYAAGTGWRELALSAGKTELAISFGMNVRIVDSDRAAVDAYGKPGEDRRVARWASGSEKDLLGLMRKTPAAQIMYGPLMLAKSVRLGSSEKEILDPATVNCGGWNLSLARQPGASGVWGAWTATFEKDGKKMSVPACDYSSAATWTKDSIEFSVFF